MRSFLNTRTNRATYWVTLLILMGLFAAVVYFTGRRVPGELVLIFVCVPRLHDIGRSGWWVLAIVLGEIVAVVVALTLVPLDQVDVAIGLFVLMLGIVLAVLGFVPGQPGPNRFGEPPAPGLSFGRPAEGPEKTFS